MDASQMRIAEEANDDSSDAESIQMSENSEFFEEAQINHSEREDSDVEIIPRKRMHVTKTDAPIDLTGDSDIEIARKISTDDEIQVTSHVKCKQ